MSSTDDTRPTPDRVLVVGAGLAGARTVLELRAQGYTGWIGLIGAESVPPYDRPPLSKHLLDRPSPAWLSDELDADALAAADDVRLSTTATRLRVGADAAEVTCSQPDGTTGLVTADVVVVATGSVPVNPWPAARTLHTAGDAQALRGSLVPGSRLVIVGAGWIGVEVAGVASAAGVEVVVVEAQDRPLPVLGTVGEYTRRWWQGVELRTGVRVAAVEPAAVLLDGGERIAGDVVLAAVGARPATGWLDGALPRDPDGSVRVDEFGAPVGPGTDEHVAARVRVVGDAARRRSDRHGWVSGGHWDAALRGPATVVAGLLGRDEVADPAPYVFSTQFGHEVALYGEPGPRDEVLLRGDPTTNDGWTALWFAPDSDVLTAVFTVDRPRDVAGARRLFAADTLPELDRERATDPAVQLRSALRS